MPQPSASRSDGRAPDSLRPVDIIPGFLKHPAGSALISFGDTRVLCTASVEDKVPGFLVGRGQGWLTAEYALLPGSTHTRAARESSQGKIGGRTHEIQRLIGRSLRGAVDLKALGERTIHLDCDVLQADGGTRTAAITGAYVALALAIAQLTSQGKLAQPALLQPVAAISVGVVEGTALLDLCYQEDHRCDVDMNVVMTGAGKYLEIQGTAEGRPFNEEHLAVMLSLARGGIRQLFVHQHQALAGVDLAALTRGEG